MARPSHKSTSVAMPTPPIASPAPRPGGERMKARPPPQQSATAPAPARRRPHSGRGQRGRPPKSWHPRPRPDRQRHPGSGQHHDDLAHPALAGEASRKARLAPRRAITAPGTQSGRPIRLGQAVQASPIRGAAVPVSGQAMGPAVGGLRRGLGRRSRLSLDKVIGVRHGRPCVRGCAGTVGPHVRLRRPMV